MPERPARVDPDRADQIREQRTPSAGFSSAGSSGNGMPFSIAIILSCVAARAGAAAASSACARPRAGGSPTQHPEEREDHHVHGVLPRGPSPSVGRVGGPIRVQRPDGTLMGATWYEREFGEVTVSKWLGLLGFALASGLSPDGRAETEALRGPEVDGDRRNGRERRRVRGERGVHATLQPVPVHGRRPFHLQGAARLLSRPAHGPAERGLGHPDRGLAAGRGLERPVPRNGKRRLRRDRSYRGLASALGQGYATAATDTGHSASFIDTR